MSLADAARRFWNAAFFYRRAPDRDRQKAVAVLKHLVSSTPGPVANRAATILKGIGLDRSDDHDDGA